MSLTGRTSEAPTIEVVLNGQRGKNVRIKCNADGTIRDLKKIMAMNTGIDPDKIRIQNENRIYKDDIPLWGFHAAKFGLVHTSEFVFQITDGQRYL